MKYLFTTLLAFAVFFINAQDFQEEEVTFSNGEVELSGTLSFPAAKAKKSPAVILVSGSGPQNRDSEVMGFKPFKLLADFFNKQGLAVLRYDDRGVGKSKGPSTSESTTADLAEDARQAYLYLSGRKDIDKKKIGLLGHSEGGVVVPIVASKEPEVAFLVLMAGFGVKGVVLSNAQQAAILKSQGMSDEYIEASGKMNGEIMAMMSDESVSDEKLTAFVKEETLKLLPMLPEAIQAQITNPEGYADMVSMQVKAQANSPWIIYYMNYDPLPTLKQVKCPVLMLFGELDTQVTPEQNAKLMETALKEAGNKNVTSAIIPEANHLFQKAKTGNPAEYATLEKEFHSQLYDELEQWIGKVVN